MGKIPVPVSSLFFHQCLHQEGVNFLAFSVPSGTHMVCLFSVRNGKIDFQKLSLSLADGAVDDIVLVGGFVVIRQYADLITETDFVFL